MIEKNVTIPRMPRISIKKSTPERKRKAGDVRGFDDVTPQNTFPQTWKDLEAVFLVVCDPSMNELWAT